METGCLITLEPNQWHKHNYIKTFFRLNLKKLEAVYRKLNGSLRLDAEKWHRYVNSKELFDLIYPLICTVTDFTLDAVAYSEPIEWLGDEIRTGKCEVYHAIPFELHDNMQLPDVEMGTKQHATRCFTTMLNHMFFKYLHKKPFMILREVNGAGSTWVGLNDDLAYFIADRNAIPTS